MEAIVKISQDTALMAKYTRRVAPIYSIDNQQATLLENIRSTKLSTFLLFKNGIDTNQYQVEGNFQDIAKVGNIIGLLHRQKPAPTQIKITSPDGQVTIVNKSN